MSSVPSHLSRRKVAPQCVLAMSFTGGFLRSDWGTRSGIHMADGSRLTLNRRYPDCHDAADERSHSIASGFQSGLNGLPSSSHPAKSKRSVSSPKMYGKKVA